LASSKPQQNSNNKENPNAFKLWISEQLVDRIGHEVHAVYPAFDLNRFVVIKTKLKPLELKQRVACIRLQLFECLPTDYPKALSILMKSTEQHQQKKNQLTGFDLWPYADFISNYGLHHVSLSLDAMKVLTTLFTSEFAIRPFLIQDLKGTLSYLKKCAVDPNVHVRRWASEGSRPRLPWGTRIPQLILDPKPTLPILSLLKNDSELYVRKSVANHLNDIAKDHPEWLCSVLSTWLKSANSKQKNNIEWIVKQALRTLIKQGNPAALKLIGVSNAVKVKVSPLRLESNQVRVGGVLRFQFKIKSLAAVDQKIVMDYRIHYKKANGKNSPKVFKLKTLNLPAGQTLQIEKKHSLKKVTTRRDYAGLHAVDIQVNGKVFPKVNWMLIL
jgi:3-methyladenine DNA glycosylase AlkC